MYFNQNPQITGRYQMTLTVNLVNIDSEQLAIETKSNL